MAGSLETDGHRVELSPQPRSVVLQFAGQGVRPENIVDYTNQLGQVDDGALLNANIAIAQDVSHFPITYYLENPSNTPQIFGLNNNALLQIVVHTLNVTAGDIAKSGLRRLGIPLNAVVAAGHSLGEVAAIDIAGGFSSRQASMEFVFARGTAMEKAHRRKPGNLYAVVGLNEAQVQQLCNENGWTVSLKNGPQSIVVAAALGLKDDIEARVKKLGGKTAIDLKIPGFHTLEYMGDAQAELREWNKSRGYEPTLVPVFSNSDASPAMSGTALVRKHIECMTMPVQWSDTLALLNHRDVKFVALGPGRNIASINNGNNIPAEQTMDLPQLLTA